MQENKKIRDEFDVSNKEKNSLILIHENRKIFNKKDLIQIINCGGEKKVDNRFRYQH